MPIEAVLSTPVAPPTGIAALVGRTPLVRLRQFEPHPGVEIYAKLESRNPGGSVKDRAALAIVLEAERTGALGSGRVLLDATSGNTGIAYAMIGAARGHRVTLCVPANITPERKRTLLAYGAELVLTDPMAGTDGAILEARRRAAIDPGRYFYADQYANAANWQAHYDTTGVELIEQTGGRLTHFVAGLGTSGTFVGTGRRLRAWRPSVVLVDVQPDSPLNGLEGMKHMATAIVPPIYDASLADRHATVDTETAYALTRRLARHEGLFVGPSSGAALAAAIDVARGVTRGVVVTMFPDGGDRYLSERFWDEDDTDASASALHVSVTGDVEQTMRADAESAYPHEGCGALFGPRDGEITAILPLHNVTDLEKRRRFLIGPNEYRAAEARAAELGLDLIGFYHSHPDHPAEPSAFDLEHAWPNLSYVIVSVREGRSAERRSWRLRADRSGYTEEIVRLLSRG
jgi:cysteine synthase B